MRNINNPRYASNRIKNSQVSKLKPHLLSGALLSAYLFSSQPVFPGTIAVDYMTMRPMATLFLSDLETVPGLVDYSVRNTAAGSVSAVLDVEIRTGSGALVFRGATDPSRYPITLEPGETRKFSNNMIKSSDLDYSTVSYDRSLLGAVMATGKIPAGTYVYTLNVYPVGQKSDSSSQSNQFVLTNPSAPTLVSPPSDTELGSSSVSGMTFSWTAPPVDSTLSVFYEISFWELQNGQSAEIAVNKTPYWSEKGLTKTSYDYPSKAAQFSAGKSYAWQVRAYDASGSAVGEDNGKSAARGFKFQDYQAATLISPVGVDVTTVSPTLQWSAVEGASSYKVEISTASGFSNSTTLTSQSTQTTLQSPLEYNAVYYWRVQAMDRSGGKVAGVSSSGKFNTPAFGQAPKLMQPYGTTLSDLQPRFSWQGIDDADAYELQLSLTSSMGAPSVVQLPPSPLEWNFEVGKMPKLAVANKYYWRVQAKRNGKNWGASSEIGSFETPQLNARPRLEIGGGAASVLPRFQWSAIEGADRYYVSVSKRPDFRDSWGTFVPGTQYTYGSGVAALELGQQYYFQVQGIQKNGRPLGYASELISFSTPEPPRAILTGPIGDIGIDQLNFKWQPVAGIEKYVIEFSPARDFSKVWTKTQTGTDITYPADLAKLNPNASYYWRVRPIDKTGASGVPSEVGYFRLNISDDQVQQLVANGNSVINPDYVKELTKRAATADKTLSPVVARQAASDLVRQVRQNPSVLAAIDPKSIDLNAIDLDALKSLNIADLKGEYQAGWEKAKDAVAALAQSSAGDLKKKLSGIDFNKYLNGLLSGLSTQEAETAAKINRPVAVDPTIVRINQSLNLNESEKLKRALIAQLAASGVDMSKYQIADIRINGKSGIPDQLKAALKEGDITLNLKEETE